MNRRFVAVALAGLITHFFGALSPLYADLNTGLVAYYPFNGNANDASGNGNNGSPTPSVTYGVDRFGASSSAALFDGTTNTYVDLPTLTTFQYRPATYSAWFKLAAYLPAQTPDMSSMLMMNLMGRERCYDGFQGAIILGSEEYTYGYANDLIFYSGSGGIHFWRTPPLQTWTHVAMTIDPTSRVCLYDNGEKVADEVYHYNQYSQFSFRIGGSSPSMDGDGYGHGRYFWNGIIDDVRIYNRALSATEVQALYNLQPTQPAVTNVRASQRSGTNLVDVWYDLSGATAPVVVSVSISTNVGASYNLQPASLTGNSVTAPVGSGTSRHLVWDAGADWPGQYSRQMRVLVSVPSGGGSAQATSPMFTLDTRSVPTGTLTGLVQGNSTPLANAQVRIDGTAFTTSTAANGRFTLATVPAGSGYLLKVSAAGFASKSVPGVNVTAGTTDLGTIQLAPLGGPYRLMPLQPDVNPPVTQVQAGGVAYRYYRLVPVKANDNPGGTTVTLSLAGGGDIQQSGPTWDDWQGYNSHYWVGAQAGIADGNGVVRLRIPASALGGPGASATLQAAVSGTVQQTFMVQVMPQRYDQVWRQQLGSGLSVDLLLHAGEDTSAQSEVRQTLVGGVLTGETIKRQRTADAKLGAEASIGSSLSVSTADYRFGGGLEVGAGADAFVAVNVSSSVGFDPYSTNAGQNAMKLYVDLGNVLSEMLGPASVVYDYVDTHIAAPFLASRLQSAEGDVQVGGEAQGEVVFGGTFGPMQADFQANASGGQQAIFGTAAAPGETATVTGVAGSWSAVASGGLVLNPYGLRGGLPDLGSFFKAGGESIEMLRKNWTRTGQGSSYRSEVILFDALGAGQQNPTETWQLYDPPALYGAYGREFTETIEQPNGSAVATYSRAVYAGQQQFGVNLDLDFGIGVSLQGELDRGAEVVNERGAIAQSCYWPTESYPPLTAAQFPTQPLSALLSQWGKNATAIIWQALNAFGTSVASGADTVIQAGSGAVLRIGQGAMSAGSWVVTEIGSVFSQVSPKRLQPKDLSATPGYGIGGIYRFESTNSFNGTGTLTIAYSPAEVAGLNPADLRMYWLPDGTNRWQLVGGTVNMASNTVTASITRLGTYTLAPPLPTGDLVLLPSTNNLAADGVSRMTIVVTNLLLNTGNVATQQWAFTATASGMTLLNPDADASTAGVQVYSTNGAVTLNLLAPRGGRVAYVRLASVVGDALGTVAVNLLDSTAPATPSGVNVTAGQSRIWVSWQTNSEADLAGYWVYYRLGASGPPWDGTAAVEGVASPVMVAGTNRLLLRGLTLATNYFVAVSAVDTTGNESPLSASFQVTTIPGAPAPPAGVSASFGQDGTNILMWVPSEDDGYNDRDVIRYDVYRAVLPAGSYTKIGQVGAGIGLYSDTNLAISPTQYVGYAVVAVASNGLTSAQAPANRFMADGKTVDTDGDGIPDWWMLAYFGHPTGQASDQSFAWIDPAGDGLSNLQKYLLGRNPLVWDNLHFAGFEYLADGRLRLTLFGQMGHNYTLLASTNLVNWTPVLTFACTNGTMDVFDPDAKSYPARFYRLAPPTGIAGPRLGLGSAHPLSSNGLDLALFSVPGLQYRVDASGDLLNWTAVSNFISTNAVIYFRDASATNYSRRFYRAVVP